MLLQASDPASCFARFMPGTPLFEERVEAFYLPEHPGNEVSFSLRGARDELIGCVTVSVIDQEIEYWIGSRYWRQGYALEALSALLPEVSGLGVGPTLYARVARENLPSAHLLERLGFRYTGLVNRHRTGAVLRYARDLNGTFRRW